MADPDQELLKLRLSELRQHHRDLDAAIAGLEHAGTGDQLRLRRLKKQKLLLKDEIGKIEDQLLPDIIA